MSGSISAPDTQGNQFLNKPNTPECVMKSRNLKRLAVVAMALLVVLLTAPSSQAQTPGSTRTRICPLNVELPPDLTIRSVKVTGRRGVGPLEEKLDRMFKGKTYTRDLHRQAMIEVENALANEVNESFEKQLNIVGGASRTPSGALFLRT